METNNQKKIDNLNETLALIEERLSEYVEVTDIPIQLLKDHKRIKREIQEIQNSSIENSKIDIIQRANNLINELDEVLSKLIRQGWNDESINEIETWIDTLEVNIESYQNALLKGKEDLKHKQSLELIAENAYLYLRKKKKATSFIDYNTVSGTYMFTKISAPSEFTDRKTILSNLKKQFNENQILAIAGVGGIGKTYLAKKFISELEGIKPIWNECTPGLSIEQFFFNVSEIMTKSYNFFNLNKLLSDNSPFTERKISMAIQQIDRIAPTIIIDDFHNADKSFEQIVIYFQKYAKSTKLIILTRRRSKSLRDVFYTAHTELIEGIDMQYLKRFLEKYKLYIDDSLIQPIFEKTKGHPQALTFIASICQNDSFEPKELLEEFSDVFGEKLEFELLNKIYEDLSNEEIELLKRASVFRLPVNRKAFGFIYQNSYHTILNSLLYRFLISEPFKSEFVIHDLIREFFYSKLENKNSIHKLAAKYYQSLISTEDNGSENYYLEAYFHLFTGEYYEDALKTVLPFFDKLILQGKYELSINIITELSNKLRNIPDELLLFKAIIFEVWGRWNESLNILENIINKKQSNTETYIKALNTLLKIYDQRGNHDAGLKLYENHKNNIKLSEVTSDVAHLYHRVGRFYHEKNNYDNLVKYYNKSLEISTQLNDLPNIIRTKRLIGTASWFFGQYEKAHEELFEVLPLCKETNNIKELSDTNKHIAIVYCKKNEFENSLKYFEESIKINKKIGYKHGLAWAMMNYSDALIELKQYSSAEENLNNALSIFSELSEKTGIINTSFRIGKLHFLRDEKENALSLYEKSYKMSNEDGFPLFKAMVLELLFEYYNNTDNKKAIGYLNEAIETYKLIGNEKYKELLLTLKNIK